MSVLSVHVRNNRTYQHCEQSTHRAQDRYPLGLSSQLVEVLKAVQSRVRISKRVQTKRQCPIVEMSWMGKRSPYELGIRRLRTAHPKVKAGRLISRCASSCYTLLFLSCSCWQWRPKSLREQLGRGDSCEMIGRVSLPEGMGQSQRKL